MGENKNSDITEQNVTDEEQEIGSDTTTRARNRTVMLTPEITGQVRAMLAQELGGSGPAVTQGPASTPPRPAQGFVRPGDNRGSAPVARQPESPVTHSSGQFGGFAGQPPSMGHSHPPVHSSPRISSAPLTPIVGFLVSFDQDPNGEVFELRAGRWIVSSEQTTGGNFMLIDHPSVSPLHAILRVGSSGEIQVLDQLSEHGTGIKRSGNEDEELLTGALSTLEHGDLVRFGERAFYVCVVLKG